MDFYEIATAIRNDVDLVPVKISSKSDYIIKSKY